MPHSLIRAPIGSGIFVINFAAQGNVSLALTENVVGGGMVLTGGASRPDAVTGANVTVMSRSNLYRADPGATPLSGWQVYGGAATPVPGFVPEATTGNTLRVHSVHDRIEGFTTAIVAAGASRPTPNPSAISFNSMSLELYGTQLSSIVADFFLAGSRSLIPGPYPDAGNVLRVLAQGVSGSGVRNNLYANTFDLESPHWALAIPLSSSETSMRSAIRTATSTHTRRRSSLAHHIDIRLTRRS